MAVYWNLGLVARTQEEAEACAEFFRRKRLKIDAQEVPLDVSKVSPLTEKADGWLLCVWPRGMSSGSPIENDPRLTEADARAHISRVFDEWLREAPPFMAAFFGGEAYDIFLDGPLSEVLEPDGFEGLVVDTPTWETMGRPAAAQSIGAGRFAWRRSPVP